MLEAVIVAVWMVPLALVVLASLGYLRGRRLRVGYARNLVLCDNVVIGASRGSSNISCAAGSEGLAKWRAGSVIARGAIAKR